MAVATVVMDRLVGLWGLFWLVALIGRRLLGCGGLEGPAAGASKLIVGVSIAVVALSLTVWFALGLLSETRATALADRLARLPKVGGSVAELWRAVWMYRKRQRFVFLALFLALIGFLGFIPAFYYSSVTLADAGAGVVPTLAQTLPVRADRPGGSGGGPAAGRHRGRRIRLRQAVPLVRLPRAERRPQLAGLPAGRPRPEPAGLPRRGLDGRRARTAAAPSAPESPAPTDAGWRVEGAIAADAVTQ